MRINMSIVGMPNVTVTMFNNNMLDKTTPETTKKQHFKIAQARLNLQVDGENPKLFPVN